MDVMIELDNLEDELSDWEAKFVESNLSRDYFTEKQKEQIGRMIERYEL